MPAFIKISAAALLFTILFLIFKQIGKSEKSVKKDFESLRQDNNYKKIAKQDALKAMSYNPKISTLVNQLSSLPNDGSQKRKMLRSEIEREILMRTKNKQEFDGCILLASEEIERRKK